MCQAANSSRGLGKEAGGPYLMPVYVVIDEKHKPRSEKTRSKPESQAFAAQLKSANPASTFRGMQMRERINPGNQCIGQGTPNY
jgi:hypothetical protein